MKFKAIYPLIAATAIAQTAQADVVNAYGRDTEVCDVCLIYSGDSSRPKWDKMHLRPYLTHKYADGHRDWFYDAFLFNESHLGSAVLGNSKGGQQAATKEEWLQYLDNLFENGHDLRMLDDMITDYKKEIGEPPLRHKVIIGTCCPAKDGSNGGAEWADINWGTVNGEKMDFSKKSNRIKATEWFIDEIIRKFDEANFVNIDLAGIYWVEESLYSNGDIVADINDYIHSKGLRSYWIPYWSNNDEYAHNWDRKYHFDLAWRQPNYFFYTTVGNRTILPPHKQLVEAIEDSKKYGLGLELEFETQGKSNGLNETDPKMHQRLIDYIDEFENQGVWDEAGVAHYSGTQGFYHMAISPDPVNQATIDRLATIVAKRQKAFAGIEDVAVENRPQFAYPGENCIYITPDAPDAVCYNAAGIAVHNGDGLFSCQPGLYIVTDGDGNSTKILVN